jgi:hypothetical protein
MTEKRNHLRNVNLWKAKQTDKQAGLPFPVFFLKQATPDTEYPLLMQELEYLKKSVYQTVTWEMKA